jgi:3-hydroxymyristoyl/3-hydroxydecanoyl-(acyl carrier protein) dehydratase
MDGRFRAFSFVDRITRLDPGHRIEGLYNVPATASRFPAALMAEAVGQLAAWSAMSAVGFARRPVAGLAGETRYRGAAVPGQTLQLAAEIERCDDEAIAYGGTASIDGRCVLELIHCVGPMLPMEEFDAPEAVRADFETLVGPGAPGDRFTGVDAPQLEATEHSAGERVRAVLRVPDAATYFEDHFPRRPVYPGTLLMDNLSSLALQLAADVPALQGSRLAVARVRDVKIRAFTAPGQALELEAQLQSASADGAQLKVAARADGRTIATARIDIERSHE